MGTLANDMNIDLGMIPNVRGFEYHTDKKCIVLSFRMGPSERLENLDVIDHLMNNIYYKCDTYDPETSMTFFYFRRPAGIDVKELEITGEHVTVVSS